MSEAFSYLNNEHKGSLIGLPFTVVLPSALPEGWAVTAVRASQFDEGSEAVLELAKGQARLFVRTANDGLGDPVGSIVTHYSHPEFGEVSVYHEEDGDFSSCWLEGEGGWTAVSGSGAGEGELGELISNLEAY